MKKCSYLTIAVVISIVLSSCTRMFFYPTQAHLSQPSELGYEYRDIFVTTKDQIRVHAWLISPNTEITGSVYFLHGNAENISTHYRATLWLLESGYEIFVLDYRGYGHSEGKPDVPEVLLDIAAGTDWLVRYRNETPGMNALPLYLYGQSLGGSLAAKYAETDPNFNSNFNGLIIEAAFDRYSTIAKHVASQNWITWSLQYPVKWLLKSNYDPVDAVANLNGLPKLFIHSREDTIVPYSMGWANYEAAVDPKQWLQATGPHIRAAAEKMTQQQIVDFMTLHADQEK